MQNQIDNDFRSIDEEIKVNKKDFLQEKTLITYKTNENILNVANENSPMSLIYPEDLLDADINKKDKDILDFYQKDLE